MSKKVRQRYRRNSYADKLKKSLEIRRAIQEKKPTRSIQANLTEINQIRKQNQPLANNGRFNRQKVVSGKNRRPTPRIKPQPKINKRLQLVEPKFHIISTPQWFANNAQVDVSIIIPLHKSAQVVKDQIKSWDFSEDGLTKEIVYVDDQCPHGSKEAVISAWSERKHRLQGPIGQLIYIEKNCGFGAACNLGAACAKGKYLIFLNADTQVTAKWVRPMYNLFKPVPTVSFDELQDVDPNDISSGTTKPTEQPVGLVGNMQLKLDGTIDSAGSEWDWSFNSFRHIGRNHYKGSEIITPMHLSQAPSELLKVEQREMVTGCCFMLPKWLFLEVEGFDENFKIGYWEDADLCLKIQQLGYKIMYQPNSRIYHALGHSKAGGHSYISHNSEYFKRKWVASGQIDKYVKNKRASIPAVNPIKNNYKGKIVGCCIVCNEEEFLEASIDSIAPLVDEFIIVVGGNEHAHQVGMCDEKGRPTDSTLNICEVIKSKYPTRIIEPPKRPWKNKVEMRNAYAKYLVPGAWMFMVDGDEVYKEQQLWRVGELMREHECLIMQFYLFWNNMYTLGTGNWMSYPQERVVRWKKGYCYNGNNHLNVDSGKNSLVCQSVPTYRGHEKLFYHYSWVRPIEKIRQKIEYYQQQLANEVSSNIPNPNYVDEVFLKWRKTPTKVQETHPRGGGSTTPFIGLHPASIERLISSGKLSF